MSRRTSAGILLYRRTPAGLEVLLGHPGGPAFRARDHGHWSVPKGEVEEGELLEAVARREFEEETGHPVPGAPMRSLGETVQKGGKLVIAWAVEGDLDPAEATSNTFEMEWPPGSGIRGTYAEIDRVAWFAPDEARARIKDAQAVFIDRLEVLLDADRPDAGGDPG
jgi:predicted NUDIX family NTP pyrophosphohydrolase